MFLRCCTNNSAATVLGLFFNAVENYGLPSSVRSDKGKENVDVEWYMLNYPLGGSERGSMICGRSVYNQRIEKIWRDVLAGVIKLYYDIFYQLEDLELTDPSSESDLFSLYCVFFPKINKHLNIWKDGWVNHKLPSEAQYTALQLFISRMLDDDYQHDIFQENILISYKFQLIIFTYSLKTEPTL